nr:SprT family zinc-dependent metalloprotease [uncultured Pseudodesulfovibrio sp.]
MTEFVGLPLTVKTHPRAKRVLVKLVPGKGLEVVMPRGFDPVLVPDILREKQGWIERNRDMMQAEGRDLTGELPDLPSVIDFKAWGRVYQVDYLARPGQVKVVENVTRLQVLGPIEDRKAVFDALQVFTVKKAREFCLFRLDALSRQTGLTYSALRIRRQKTRWGSCSARGTISLNAKLLFLPPKLVDHLILHELCHTRQLNHSKHYWALVASYEPEYLRLEDEVRRGGKYVPRWFA